MLTRRDIQINLLHKLNELCDKANVKYVLHGHGAFLAYSEEEIPTEKLDSLEVLMCQGDAEKIVDLLDDNNYYFEDFRTNPKFDKHCMMFGYKNSTDLKMKELNFLNCKHIEKNCIYITINFIEHSSNKKILKLKELMWKLKDMNITTNKLWYLKLSSKLLNVLYKFRGKEGAIKHRYNTKKNNYSIWTWDNIKKYSIIKIDEEEVSSKIFEDIISKDLDGVPSFIFKDFNTYATQYYGKRWKKKNWKGPGGVTSNIVSWEEYSNDPEFKKMVEEIQERYEEVYSKDIKLYKYRKVITKMKEQVIQSGNVVHTREKILKEKDKILKLWENKDIKELGKILNPLIISMKKSIKLGYSYSVDEEIDKVLDLYLREINNNKLADKIQQKRK